MSLGSDFIDSRDEAVELNYNAFEVNTNPLINPNIVLNGRQPSSFPRALLFGTTPAVASGGAGADVIAVWTGHTTIFNNFSDATGAFSPIYTNESAYWNDANPGTDTAFNVPSGGLYNIKLRVLLSAAITAGNSAMARIDMSINSGGSFQPSCSNLATQSGNANPPPITIIGTELDVYVNPAQGAGNWFRFAASSNYATNFTFFITVTRMP